MQMILQNCSDIKLSVHSQMKTIMKQIWGAQILSICTFLITSGPNVSIVLVLVSRKPRSKKYYIIEKRIKTLRLSNGLADWSTHQEASIHGRPCLYHGIFEPIRSFNAQLFELSSKSLDFASSKNLIVFFFKLEQWKVDLEAFISDNRCFYFFSDNLCVIGVNWLFYHKNLYFIRYFVILSIVNVIGIKWNCW